MVASVQQPNPPLSNRVRMQRCTCTSAVLLQALMVVGWCQSSSCPSEDWCRTVHVVTAVEPPSPQAASPGEAPAASPGSPVRSGPGAEDPHHRHQQQQAELIQGRESDEAQYRSVPVAPMALAERLGVKPQLELLAALSAASGSGRGSPVTPTLSSEAAAWPDAALTQHGRYEGGGAGVGGFGGGGGGGVGGYFQ